MSDAAAIGLVVAIVALGSAAVFWLQARFEHKRKAAQARDAAEFERRQSSPNLAEVE